jgi:glycosyltransferase involved in cell wall biosynthesis
VLNQTYTHWECIIVDDYSTDNSWEILEKCAVKDSRFKLFRRPKDRLAGGNAARNFGFELSKGEYINWLDSDDILHINSIFEKVKVIVKNKQLDFVFGDILEFDTDISKAKKVSGLGLSQTDINYPLQFLKGNFWVGSMLPLFRKSFLTSFENCFNEKLKRDQETEFFVRIFLNNPAFQFIETSLAYWRRSENSKTSIFRSLSLGERQLASYRSFKVIFLNFKKGRKISDEEKYYFKWYFGVQLVTMKVTFNDYLDLLFFGLRNDTFPNYFFLPKILIYRLFKSMGIDLKNIFKNQRE